MPTEPTPPSRAPPPAEEEARRPVSPSSERALAAERGEQRALGWVALAAVAAIAWIFMPVGVGILLGTLLGFTLQPLFERLKPRLGPRWASLTLVFGSVLTLAITLGGLGWLLVARGVLLTRGWIDALGPGGPGAAVFRVVGGVTARFGFPPDELATRARGLAEQAAASVAIIAEAVVATTAGSVLALFFAMLSMHFILRNWEGVSLSGQEALPLRPEYTAALFAEFRRVGRSTLVGTVGTGLAQGLLATIGYLVAGAPEPVFFGALTAVASLVPAIGAALVWAPVGIVLTLSGHETGGIFELAWGGAVVAALCDYVIRPALVGGAGELPSLFTFAALLGGVQVFGLKGLIVGPLLMSLAVAVLRIYATESRGRRASLRNPSAPPPAPTS